MEIVVCAKITVDTAELKADAQSRAPQLGSAPRKISTVDENAIEEAVRIGEMLGGRVTALVLGDDVPEDLLLRVLAMGADRLVVVRDDSVDAADSLASATILVAALRRLAPWDLVLCGEGSLDHYNRQVGPRLGEELDLPVLTQVVGIRLDGPTLLVERLLDDRTEEVEAELPALVTARQELNEPRLPTVLQILAASRKPRLVWSLEDLGFPPSTTAAGISALVTLETKAPPATRRCCRIEGESVEVVAAEASRRLFVEGAIK